jgi:hypothetical protein
MWSASRAPAPRNTSAPRTLRVDHALPLRLTSAPLRDASEERVVVSHNSVVRRNIGLLLLGLATVAGVDPLVSQTATASLRHIRDIEQQKPDFSGEWTLNRQASTLSPGADAAQSGVLRIEHREPRFAGQQTIVLNGKPVESKFELLSDGREVATTDDRGRQIVSSLRWDGDALVASWRIQGANNQLTISFRYELQDGGRRLRSTEQLRGAGRDQDNVWVFDRP